MKIELTDHSRQRIFERVHPLLPYDEVRHSERWVVEQILETGDRRAFTRHPPKWSRWNYPIPKGIQVRYARLETGNGPVCCVLQRAAGIERWRLITVIVREEYAA